MEKFDIQKIARSYVFKRFPNASNKEKEKIINDWVMKEKDSNLLVKDFIERVGAVAEKKILDAGSGNGGVSISFAKNGASVSGVDIEKDLYEVSIRQKENLGIKNVDFILYDGVKIPFEDNYFDYALSLSVLEHTDDPKEYLKEILRTVKVGGVLYLGFPNKIWPKETHTGLWFLTYLPSFLKPYMVSIFKKNPLPDNNLHFYGLSDLLSFINTDGKYKWEVIKEDGKSMRGVKFILKKILSLFNLNYKMFLPHILLILRKVKNEK